MMIKSYLSLIKFSHTVFALPFALIGFFIAVNTPGFHFEWPVFLLVLACMVTARSAAMAFNRWADKYIDLKNPRTINREIPSGIIQSKSALVFVVINAILFMLFAFFINITCFLLSPIALFIILGYSYTKRFSWLCHIILGLGLALAPIGAYIAVTGSFHILPIMYSIAVITWVAGFDILYALQDVEFDHKEHLHSIPVHFGMSKSLAISTSLHVVCGISIIASAYLLQSQFQLGFISWIGTFLFLALLVYQHTIISEKDLSRINLAFFTTNGIASILLAFFILFDLYLKS